jgi:hypothetical protein
MPLRWDMLCVRVCVCVCVCVYVCVSKLASSLLFSGTDTEIKLTSRGAPVSLSLSGAGQG